MEAMAFGFAPAASDRVSEYFSHFSYPSQDFTIEQVIEEPYYPTATVDKNAKTITYDIPVSPLFTDLSETVLCFSSQIFLANGKKLPPAKAATDTDPGYAAAGWANNPSTTIFKNLFISINDQPITSGCNNYAILAYLENLLFFTKEYKVSWTCSSLFTIDNCL